jgi:hypothetical protein
MARGTLPLPGTDLPAFREQSGPGRPVDRAVDAPSSQEGGIGGVHDRIGPLLRDVTQGQLKLPAPELAIHPLPLPPFTR